MFHYKDDVGWKKKVDEMQLSYRCCGVKDYKDWFHISWLQTTYVPKGGELTGYIKLSDCHCKIFISPDDEEHLVVLKLSQCE